MNILLDSETVVRKRRYRVVVFRLPGGARVRAEASQDGQVIESVDGAGQLAARAGLRRRLARGGRR